MRWTFFDWGRTHKLAVVRGAVQTYGTFSSRWRYGCELFSARYCLHIRPTVALSSDSFNVVLSTDIGGRILEFVNYVCDHGMTFLQWRSLAAKCGRLPRRCAFLGIEGRCWSWFFSFFVFRLICACLFKNGDGRKRTSIWKFAKACVYAIAEGILRFPRGSRWVSN